MRLGERFLQTPAIVIAGLFAYDDAPYAWPSRSKHASTGAMCRGSSLTRSYAVTLDHSRLDHRSLAKRPIASGLIPR